MDYNSIEEVLGGATFEGILMDTFNEPVLIGGFPVWANISSSSEHLIARFNTEVETNGTFCGVRSYAKDEWEITHSSLLSVSFDTEYQDHLLVTLDSPFNDGELLVNWLFKKR